MRGIAHWEAIGLAPSAGLKKLREKIQELDSLPPSPQLDYGIAAHAPYSCSVDLIKQIVLWNQTSNRPFHIHLSESTEEEELFLNQTGSLYDLCFKIYPQVTYPFNKKISKVERTPIQYLNEKKLLPNGSLLTHCNVLTKDEISWLAKKEVSVVHCPQSHRYFSHPLFLYEDLQRQDVNIVLGTDSLASAKSLSLFDEMRLFKKNYPQVSNSNILSMVTSNAAKALNKEKQIGTLFKGMNADFIFLPDSHSTLTSSCLESICDFVIQQGSTKGLIQVIGGNPVVA